MTNEEPLLLPQQAESLHPRIDWEQVQQGFHQLVEGINRDFFQPLAKAFQQVAEALQPTFQAVIEIAQKVNEAVWNAYIEDGAIYEESQEGMLRWMQERGEAARLRREAEDIEERLAGLRAFRRQLEERRLHHD